MAYKNVKQLMGNCEHPTTYDFTLECDHEDYKALSPLEQFLTYKSAGVGERILSDVIKGEPDERTAEGCYREAANFSVESYRKSPNLTDWDGWDGKCELAVDLYEQLWGWREGEQRRYSSLFRKVNPFGLMGGDTLNSVQTTMNCYLEELKDEQEIYRQQLLPNPKDPTKSGKASIRFCLQLYRLFGKDFIRQLAGKDELYRFVQLTHTMGNLVLVPAGYNGYRGRAKQMRDYADLSLFNLLHNCDGKSEELWGEDEETRKGNVTKYINFSFLWDYVEKGADGAYHVQPLCDSHRRKMETWAATETWDEKNVLPKKEEMEEMCRNINSRVIRRGRFMSMMLEISLKYSDVYDRLMQTVFLTERIYDGYEEVIEVIRENVRGSRDKEVSAKGADWFSQCLERRRGNG